MSPQINVVWWEVHHIPAPLISMLMDEDVANSDMLWTCTTMLVSPSNVVSVFTIHVDAGFRLLTTDSFHAHTFNIDLGVRGGGSTFNIELGVRGEGSAWGRFALGVLWGNQPGVLVLRF